MSIKCPQCKTENLDSAKYCGSCGALIINKTQSQNQEIAEKKHSYAWLLWLLAIGGLIFFISSSEKTPADSEYVAPIESAESQTLIQEEWKKTHTALPLPTTGVVYKASKRGNSPLQIFTESQSGDSYFIKIDNVNTGQNAMKLFIRSGDSIKVNLPVGSYEIKYASGASWYGETDLFGLETSYSKAEEIFTFDEYNGYKIELIKQADGNLQTSNINANAF